MADRLRIDMEKYEELGAMVGKALNGKRASRRGGLADVSRNLLRVDAIGVDTTHESIGEFSPILSQAENSEIGTIVQDARTAPSRKPKIILKMTAKVTTSSVTSESESIQPANPRKRKIPMTREANSLRDKRDRDYKRGIRRPTNDYF
jgi:hypothetical protein